MGRVKETSWADRALLWWPSSRPGHKHELASSQGTEKEENPSEERQTPPFYKPHFPLLSFKSVVEKSIRKLKFFNLIVKEHALKR